ncbi:hypothetical protein, partial [Klebsiella aerogenes]|uniref:hypothetical protein n=1 Tax=Klebsiella aerogenes TaxID=548 RepID=UPI00195431AE
KGVLAGVPASRLWPTDKAEKDLIIVANTEVNTDEDRAAFVAALTEALAGWFRDAPPRPPRHPSCASALRAGLWLISVATRATSSSSG